MAGSTPSTVHPMLRSFPGDPLDDRIDGVHLLEFDEDTKTTAELVEQRYWRICDWELMDDSGELIWFSRSWHCIPVAHLKKLADLTPELCSYG